MIKEFFKTTLYEPLFNLLVFFAWLVPGHSIGWAIILLTILVKVVLWVPSLKSIQTPILLRLYQDEMKAIQERYKDDRAAQSQALMAFYKEKGVNPLSGCLPLLIQLPVVLILYRVFMVGLSDLRPDLLYSFTPRLDSINASFFGLDLAAKDRFILPLLAGVFQYFQARHLQRLNPPTTTNPSDPSVIISKQSTFLFPIMTFFVTFSVPAGLGLYWVTSTALQLLQQVYVEKTFRPTQPKVSVSVRSKKKK